MQGNDHHVDEVLRHSRAIRSETSALVGELRGAADEIGRTLNLKGRMEKSPWLTMAAFVGIGYVLGGGLFTPLSARLVRLGTRALLLPLLRAHIEGLASGLAEPAQFSQSEDGSCGM